MGKKKIILILLSILLVGTGLRVWRFDAIQPVNSDEAMYLRQGRFIATLARFMCGADVPVVNSEGEGIMRYVQKTDWYDKPCWLHSFLIALSMLMFGISTGAGAVAGVFFSMATVWLVYLTGRRMFGHGTALVSAGLLAVSGYWMIYSRSFWAEVDAVFFVVASFYLILRSCSMTSWRWYMMLLTAGAVGALAVLCHYRLLYIGMPLCLTAFVMIKGIKRKIIGAFMVGLGYLGLILAVAGILRLAFNIMDVEIPFSGLIGALMERYMPGRYGMAGSAQTGFQPLNSLAFLYYLFRNNGVFTFTLFFAGILCGLVNTQNRKRTSTLTCFMVLPLLVLSLQVWVVARAGSLMIPFFCLLAGNGAVLLWRGVGTVQHAIGRRIGYCVMCVLVVGSVVENLIVDSRLARNNMGHAYVTECLKQEGAKRIFADPETACIYNWYAPDLRIESLHRLHDRLTEPGVSGSYVVFDAQKYHMYPESTARVGGLEARVNERGDLLWTVSNLTTMRREFLLEGTQAHNLSDMLASIRRADLSDVTAIRVYRLR